MNHKITEALITEQLEQQTFKSGAATIKRLPDPQLDTPMVVTLDQLRAYENNPRQTKNPLYDDLKASIKARGLDHSPPITRRPGEEHFIISTGGNTRLAILNELYAETKEDRFFRIHCLFRPWQSEANALIGHLAENELHGALTFIERAQGVAQMKALYEAELSEELSLRRLSERLRADGYPLSHVLISRMLECINSIQPALPNTLLSGLGRPQIENLIILKNSLTKVWNKYNDSDFLEFWLMVLSMHDNGPESFNFEVIRDQMLGQMAAMLGQDYHSLELDLEIAGNKNHLDKNPLSPEALKAIEANPPQPITPAVPSTGTNQHSDPKIDEYSEKQEDWLDDAGDSLEEPISQINQAEHQPPSNTAERMDSERQAIIDGHIVSPSNETERVTRIKQQVAQVLGDTLPNFEENALKAIPVMAGGHMANVSDVWYIEKQIDSPADLRHQISLLVSDLARFGNIKGIFATQEGLGFGFDKLEHDSSPTSNTVFLLLTSLLRLNDNHSNEQLPAPLSAALFSQILVGSYDITIGHNPAKDIGLKRLPDVEHVNLFRLIRLARKLVDYCKEEGLGHAE